MNNAMNDQDSGDFDPARTNSRLRLDDTPATRAALEAHPSLWPRGFSEIPRGWDTEVARALIALAKLSGETGIDIATVQIKSKFGELRMYLDVSEDSVGPLEMVASTPRGTQLRSSAAAGSVRDRAHRIIDAAAARCARLCEQCGADDLAVREMGLAGNRLPDTCPPQARRCRAVRMENMLAEYEMGKVSLADAARELGLQDAGFLLQILRERGLPMP